MVRAKKRAFSIFKVLSCVSGSHRERDEGSEPYTKQENPTVNMSAPARSADRVHLSHPKRKQKRRSINNVFSKLRSGREEKQNRVCQYSSESEDEDVKPVFIEMGENGETEVKYYTSVVNGCPEHIAGMAKPPSIEISNDEDLNDNKSSPSNEKLSSDPESPAVELPAERSSPGTDQRMSERYLKRQQKTLEVMEKYNVKPTTNMTKLLFKSETNLSVSYSNTKKTSLPTNSLFPPTHRDRRQRLASHENLTQLQLDMRERGEKVGELDNKTQRLNLSSTALSRSMNDLASKVKDKKWYEW